MTEKENEMVREITASCVRLNGTGFAEAEIHLFTRTAFLEVRLRLGSEDLRQDYWDRSYMVDAGYQGEERIRELNAVRNKLRGWEKIKLGAMKAATSDWKVDIPEPFANK